MKNRFFAVLFVALFGFLSMAAQDMIYKKDGSTVACQVEEITETAVKYRAAKNPTGPLYNLSIDKIIKIVYKNGETDIFDASLQSAPIAQPTATQPAQQPYYGQQQQTNLNDADLLALAMADKTLHANFNRQAKNLRIIGWTVGPAFLVAGTMLLIASEGHPDNEPELFYSGLTCALVGAATCVTCNVIAHSKSKKADRADLMSISVDREVLKMGDKSLCLGVNYSKDKLAHVSSFGPSLSIRF